MLGVWGNWRSLEVRTIAISRSPTTMLDYLTWGPGKTKASCTVRHPRTFSTGFRIRLINNTYWPPLRFLKSQRDSTNLRSLIRMTLEHWTQKSWPPSITKMLWWLPEKKLTNFTAKKTSKLPSIILNKCSSKRHKWNTTEMSSKN